MSVTDRRTLLTAVAGGVAATTGCLDGVGGRATDEPDSREPTPVPCPTEPDPLTTESVGSYVVAFERAFAHREAIREFDDPTEVTVNPGEPTVEPLDEGHRVVLSEVFRSVTVEAGIADAEWIAAYLVTADDTLRATSRSATPPDPRASGVSVECPPG